MDNILATSRMYWATVALLNVVVLLMVMEWAITTHNAWTVMWDAVLAIVVYWAWQHRENKHAARLAMVAPIVVSMMTGLAGRWH